MHIKKNKFLNTEIWFFRISTVFSFFKLSYLSYLNLDSNLLQYSSKTKVQRFFILMFYMEFYTFDYILLKNQNNYPWAKS